MRVITVGRDGVLDQAPESVNWQRTRQPAGAPCSVKDMVSPVSEGSITRVVVRPRRPEGSCCQLRGSRRRSRGRLRRWVWCGRAGIDGDEVVAGGCCGQGVGEHVGPTGATRRGVGPLVGRRLQIGRVQSVDLVGVEVRHPGRRVHLEWCEARAGLEEQGLGLGLGGGQSGLLLRLGELAGDDALAGGCGCGVVDACDQAECDGADHDHGLQTIHRSTFLLGSTWAYDHYETIVTKLVEVSPPGKAVGGERSHSAHTPWRNRSTSSVR